MPEITRIGRSITLGPVSDGGFRHMVLRVGSIVNGGVISDEAARHLSRRGSTMRRLMAKELRKVRRIARGTHA